MNDLEMQAHYEVLLEDSFYQFVQEAWDIVDPSAYIDGWHIKTICDHLQAVYEGKIKRLIINIPPGFAKSLISSVFYPAWVWLKNPKHRFLTGSYAADLAIRDTRRCRQLIQSEWYQYLWSDKYKFVEDQNQKSFFYNDKNGYRTAFSTGSAITGHRGDTIILDDPLNYKFAHSDKIRNSINTWILEALFTRLNDQAKGAIIIIMQRLHEDDVTGFLLEKTKGWEHLCLPMEYEQDRKCKTSIFTDPRKKENEILWHNISRETLDEYKTTLGTYAVAGQLQQRPSPASGGLVKRKDFKYFSLANQPKFNYVIQAWDTAVETKEENDFSVGVTAGFTNDDVYIFDIWKGKVEYPELARQIELYGHKHSPTEIHVEKKQSGQQILQDLTRRSRFKILPFETGRLSKEARLIANTPLIEQGHVYLPDEANWVSDFLDEICTFPFGKHDDQVDSFAIALSVFQEASSRMRFISL